MINIHTLKTKPYESIKNQNKKFGSFGIYSLDNALDGIVSGTVTVITGRPSEGKSTFLHGVILKNIDYGKRVHIVDGEHILNDLYNKLFRQVIGSDNTLYTKVTNNIKTRYEPKPHIQEMLNKWFGDKLMLSLKHESNLSDFDELFKIAEESCKKHNVDIIIFDNMASIIDSTVAELNAKQSKFIKLCSSLAKSANVAVILVSHPNGTAQKGKAIDYYQISGSSDIINIADNVIQVIKDPIEDDGSIKNDGRIVILKNRYFSEYPIIDLTYDKELMALCENSGDSYIVNQYNWRNEGIQEGFTKETNSPF